MKTLKDDYCLVVRLRKVKDSKLWWWYVANDDVSNDNYTKTKSKAIAKIHEFIDEGLK